MKCIVNTLYRKKTVSFSNRTWHLLTFAYQPLIPVLMTMVLLCLIGGSPRRREEIASSAKKQKRRGQRNLPCYRLITSMQNFIAALTGAKGASTK